MPAYPMPDNLSQVTVQRIVVRNGLSHDLATAFLADMRSAVGFLDGLDGPVPHDVHKPPFHH